MGLHARKPCIQQSESIPNIRKCSIQKFIRRSRGKKYSYILNNKKLIERKMEQISVWRRALSVGLCFSSILLIL